MRRARAYRAAPLILVVATSARADDRSQEWSAADAAESGNFLPYSESPSTSATYVTTLGGYDTAREQPRFTGELQLRLHERVYFLATGSYEDLSDHTLEPGLALQVIVVEEKDAGVDVAVFGGWEHSGFNTGDDALARAAVAGHVHGGYLLGGAAFGVWTGSRSGELDFGGIRETISHLYVGFDSRGRLDLEHTDTWDLEAGPAASYVIGMFAVSATADVAKLPGRLGAVTALGFAAVF